MSGTTNFNLCGPAVTVPLNQFLLQPWSYTKTNQENSDCTADAVNKMCTMLPLVTSTHFKKSCLSSPMSPSRIG